MDKPTEPNEDRLDEILQQLEDDEGAISKAFGKPGGTSTPPTPISPSYGRTGGRERRVYSGKPNRVRSTSEVPEPDGPKVEPSRIKPYPNVYRTEGGEPVEWVGFFKDEETANMWVKDRPGSFMVEFGEKRDLPLWGREERKRKHGNKA